MTRLIFYRWLSIFSLVFFVLFDAAAAPPNLWWTHVETTVNSQSECIDNAESVFKERINTDPDSKSVKIKKDSNSIRLVNNSMRAVVECLHGGGQNRALIITSSTELESGDALYQSLKFALGQ